MITIWCHQRSTSVNLLVDKLNEMGHPARRQIGGPRPTDVILWGQGGGNKLHELIRLAEAGLPVPPHKLSPSPGWLRRNFHHIGGNDLRQGTGHDFYVERLDIVEEFRFHIFDGLSIRRQVKVPRNDHPHEWIRSWASGWKLMPGGNPPRGSREAAVRAVEALGYTFGAVDVGRLRGGGFVVLEVNTAPGIEGSTVTKYAEGVIKRYAQT